MDAMWIIAGTLAGVEPELLSSLCFVESSHKPGAYVAMDGNSPSLGICQIKLATARQMGFKGSAKELMDPSTNAIYAALYLQWQYKRYGCWDKAISAYNAGRAITGNKKYVNKVKRGVSPVLMGAL